MRFGFFYDGPITRNSEGQYFGTAINDEMFLKYFDVADELEVCIRFKKNDATSGLKQIKNEKIFFTECVNLSSFRGIFLRTKAKKSIMSVLQRCDGAFIRMPSYIGQIAAECCEKKGIPYIVELVGCPLDSLWSHSVKGKFVALPTFLQTKHIIKHAPAVLYVTNCFLQKRYPTNGVSIACSDVALPNIDEFVLEKRINKILEQGTKIVIGTIGAVNVRFKGQERVIKALGELKKEGYTCFEYHLVGGGNQEYLKKVIKDNDVEELVKVVGALPHEKVLEWLDTIDLYIQPSKTEGLPRALIEAMSRALPALGANVGGIPELLGKELIFNNSKKCVNEIKDFLLNIDKEKMYDLAKKNFETAKQYEYKKLETRRKDFYQKVFR